MKISNANIVITDKLMERVYNSDVVDLSTTYICNNPDLLSLNFFSDEKNVFSLLRGLPNKPFFICGSSNFHHLDAFNLARHYELTGRPLQLVLIDRHMDAQDFEATRFLHCGNWVSYCYRHSWISKIAMIGCDDFRGTRTFDQNLIRNPDLVYYPTFDQANLSGFFVRDADTYVSIDTDVLDVPSDWGIGKHPIQKILTSPLWEDLVKLPVVGAFLHGHVSDGRGLGDILVRGLKGGIFESLNFRTSFLDSWYCFHHKLVASLFQFPRKPARQLAIIRAFYEKLVEIGVGFRKFS